MKRKRYLAILRKTTPMPEVSVILPTYNRAKTLHRAIQSVLNQTFGDFELIIVDDGSTDDTEEAIKAFRDNRIKYIKCKENKGAPVARNTGIGLAEGEYVAFQDSDDEWLPEKLEKQMKIFETTPINVGIVYTAFWQKKDNSQIYIPYASVKQKEGDIHTELLKESFIGLPTVVIRKKCFEKAGMFDENLPRLQDWELVIRLAKHYNFRFIDEPLVTAYYLPDSITANRSVHIKALEIILTKHFEDFAKDKKILAKRYFYLSELSYLYGIPQKGRDYYIKAAKLVPLNVKFLLTAALSQNVFNKIKLFCQNLKKLIKSD